MSVEVLISLDSCNRVRASCEASDSDIYSASMVESATVDCLCEVQDAAPLLAKKM